MYIPAHLDDAVGYVEEAMDAFKRSGLEHDRDDILGEMHNILEEMRDILAEWRKADEEERRREYWQLRREMEAEYRASVI